MNSFMYICPFDVDPPYFCLTFFRQLISSAVPVKDSRAVTIRYLTDYLLIFEISTQL